VAASIIAAVILGERAAGALLIVAHWLTRLREQVKEQVAPPLCEQCAVVQHIADCVQCEHRHGEIVQPVTAFASQTVNRDGGTC